MGKIMLNQPQHEVDLSAASVSQCHSAPVSKDYVNPSHPNIKWYRCHECNKSCAIRRIPSTGYDWCDNCHARGYVKVANPLKLVGYDQTQLDRSPS
jgi:hypothetical protein